MQPALALLVLLGILPSVLANEPAPAPAPNVGALTLEVSPAARLFTLVAPAADNRMRRGAAVCSLSVHVPAPYDQELSDFFPQHDPARGPVFIPKTAPAQSRVVSTVDAPAPRPAGNEPVAVPFDWSAPVVAPTAPLSPASAPAHDAFAADRLRALTRGESAEAVGATWRETTRDLTAPLEDGRSPDLRSLRTAGDFLGGLPAGHRSMGTGPVPAAFASSGAVYAWGYNSNGQLGNGTTTNSSRPAPVSSANGFINTNITTLAAGDSHSLALQGGAVYAWGSNSNGQLGNNSLTDSSVPVPVSSNGTFLNTGVTAIAAGVQHSLALQGGAVYAWGYNAYGQLGNNSTTDSRVPVAVSLNGTFTNKGVTAIAAGASYSMALQNGVAYAWGYNPYGQLGNGTTTSSLVPVAVSSANGFINSNVTAIAAGDEHSLAIRNGALYAWGFNSNGQLGNNSTTDSSVPVAVLNLSTGVTSVAADINHSLAVQNGNVFAWGFNGFGQLGNNSTTDSSVPVEVSYNGSFLSGIVQVAAGVYSSYALATDGSLYVWGYNGIGELGLGTTTTQYLTPQHLTPPSGQYYELIDSDADGLHALAILGSSPVPEPATWLAGGLTLAAAILTLRRRLL